MIHNLEHLFHLHKAMLLYSFSMVHLIEDFKHLGSEKTATRRGARFMNLYFRFCRIETSGILTSRS